MVPASELGLLSCHLFLICRLDRYCFFHLFQKMSTKVCSHLHWHLYRSLVSKPIGGAVVTPNFSVSKVEGVSKKRFSGSLGMDVRGLAFIIATSAMKVTSVSCVSLEPWLWLFLRHDVLQCGSLSMAAVSLGFCVQACLELPIYSSALTTLGWGIIRQIANSPPLTTHWGRSKVLFSPFYCREVRVKRWSFH